MGELYVFGKDPNPIELKENLISRLINQKKDLVEDALSLTKDVRFISKAKFDKWADPTMHFLKRGSIGASLTYPLDWMIGLQDKSLLASYILLGVAGVGANVVKPKKIITQFLKNRDRVINQKYQYFNEGVYRTGKEILKTSAAIAIASYAGTFGHYLSPIGEKTVTKEINLEKKLETKTPKTILAAPNNGRFTIEKILQKEIDDRLKDYKKTRNDGSTRLQELMNVTYKRVLRYSDHIVDSAKRHNIDALYLLALIGGESDGRVNVVSHYGGVGPTQLRYFPAKKYGIKNLKEKVHEITDFNMLLGESSKDYDNRVVNMLNEFATRNSLNRKRIYLYKIKSDEERKQIKDEFGVETTGFKHMIMEVLPGDGRFKPKDAIEATARYLVDCRTNSGTGNNFCYNGGHDFHKNNIVQFKNYENLLKAFLNGSNGYSETVKFNIEVLMGLQLLRDIVDNKDSHGMKQNLLTKLYTMEMQMKSHYESTPAFEPLTYVPPENFGNGGVPFESGILPFRTVIKKNMTAKDIAQAINRYKNTTFPGAYEDITAKEIVIYDGRCCSNPVYGKNLTLGIKKGKRVYAGLKPKIPLKTKPRNNI